MAFWRAASAEMSRAWASSRYVNQVSATDNPSVKVLFACTTARLTNGYLLPLIFEARPCPLVFQTGASGLKTIRESRAAVARQVLVVPASFCVADCCCRGRNDIHVVRALD
jgi:hypothetical protein